MRLGLLAVVVALAVATASMSRAQLVTEADSASVEDVHPQDSAEDRGLRVVSRDGRVRMRFLGSIRLAAIYDIDGVESRERFITYDIPVGANQQVDPRFEMHADQTRFGMEIHRQTRRFGDAFGRIEADFFVESGVPRFRLRHAFARVQNFLLGQTWTTFSDVAALPLTVDFEGPNSAVTIRTAQVRWTKVLSQQNLLAIGLESPEPAVKESGEATVTNQIVPDAVIRYRWTKNPGHLQLAAVLRQLAYRDVQNDLRYIPAWGVQASGKIQFDEDLGFLFQAVTGSGISKYIGTLSEQGLDLIPTPDGELEAVFVLGGYVSFTIEWSDNTYSSLTAGAARVRNKDYQPDDAYRLSQYLAGNLFWEPTAGLRSGVEVLWGRRENKDGQRGDARRAQFGFYFDF